MNRYSHPSRDEWPAQSRLMRRRTAPPPVPTLGELRRMTSWVWLHCWAPGCGYSRAVALAPYIIRWGADASSDLLRRSVRCSHCGAKGAEIIHPSWVDQNLGYASFPRQARPAGLMRGGTTEGGQRMGIEESGT